jgi:dihydropteroate synthase
MGVVNVTPDSFYDGGRHDSADGAIEHGLRLASEGADILDIGGASSRPGAPRVPAADEARRILPVVIRLAREFNGPVSIDTTSALVAEQALDAGAAWINDISAGRADAGMARLAAVRGCTVVLMHSRGTPVTMQSLTTYGDDLAAEVLRELLAPVSAFAAAGVRRENIVLDPGIGFAKTAQQNLSLLAGLGVFVKTGYPVLVGTSRKSFVGHVTGRGADDRLYGTLGSVAAAYSRGARIFRVHDVAATVDFLKVLSAIEKGGTSVSEKQLSG